MWSLVVTQQVLSSGQWANNTTTTSQLLHIHDAAAPSHHSAFLSSFLALTQKQNGRPLAERVRLRHQSGAEGRRGRFFPLSSQFSPFYFLPRILITLHLQVIRLAGESEIKVSTKSSTVDLVTKTDERVEKIIIGALKEEFGEGSHWWDSELAANRLPIEFTWELFFFSEMYWLLAFPAASLGRSQWQRGSRAS